MSERLIDRLVQDHDARRRKVNVLGIDVWVTPLTVAESAQIVAKHPGDAAQRQAETLVLKCRTEDGQPIFTKEDKPALAKKVAGDRLGPLFNAINGESVEAQAEK